jgi:hypothetical protein
MSADAGTDRVAMLRHIQYGCGLNAPTSWRNFDISPTLRLQKIPLVAAVLQRRGMPKWSHNVEYGDIVAGLPVEPDSCKAVYCSHVLEHLALDDFRRALRNTYLYLEAGGIFRFVLPDLEYYARQYLNSESSDAALRFMEVTVLGVKTRARGAEGILRTVAGNSAHLWMWDYKAIAAELEQAGFRDIRRAAFNDSQDELFKDVEEFSRWENCLGVECFK